VASEKLVGDWINLDTKEKFKVVLNRLFKFEHFDDTQFDTLELMQCGSTKNDLLCYYWKRIRTICPRFLGLEFMTKFLRN